MFPISPCSTNSRKTFTLETLSTIDVPASILTAKALVIQKIKWIECSLLIKSCSFDLFVAIWTFSEVSCLWWLWAHMFKRSKRIGVTFEKMNL